MIELNNHQHGVAIAGKARCQYHPESDVVFSNSRGNELLGGFIYTDFTGSCVNVHMAAFSKRWLSPDMVWLMFDYPFAKLGVRKIVAKIKASNTAALDFSEHLGFTAEARIRHFFPDGDAVIVSLYRENCRWLGMRKRTLNNGR